MFCKGQILYWLEFGRAKVIHHSANTSQHLAVFLATVDLQAKGYVLGMSMHNGEYGCPTSEEPGTTMKQGKGYDRQYPYRSCKLAMRNTDDIKFHKDPKATRRQ